MTGRSSQVTGDEPGTCKAITGTPYAGVEQYRGFCQADKTSAAQAVMQPRKKMAGSVMTGQQPAVGGSMTGDSKGACEIVSGTPYLGADQVALACPGTPAEPGSPDFPQMLDATPWGGFSVQSPAATKAIEQKSAGVTGAQSLLGNITGPFGMAAGKVTGTEEARYGHGNNMPQPIAEMSQIPDAAMPSRVTGEGMSAGSKITGDDWERGDRVTGTEGASVKGRNPTLRGGPMSAMAPLKVNTRNDELPEPVSKVTGGSGNTEKGALVTYSGGARG
jgi:hypothetical protein